MKKVFCLLVVMAFAAPSLYANDITFDACDAGGGVLHIMYTVDGGSADIPVGVSLAISCSDGAHLKADPCARVIEVDPCFPVYLDYAHDNPGGYDFDPPQGEPLADVDGAGLPDLANDPCEFSVCMGALETTTEKGVQKTLVKIQLYEGTDSCTDVTITSDGLRGGTVGSQFNVVVPGAPVEVCFAAVVCCPGDICDELRTRPLVPNGDVGFGDVLEMADLVIANGYLPIAVAPGHELYCGDMTNELRQGGGDGQVGFGDVLEIADQVIANGYLPLSCPPGAISPP